MYEIDFFFWQPYSSFLCKWRQSRAFRKPREVQGTPPTKLFCSSCCWKEEAVVHKKIVNYQHSSQITLYPYRTSPSTNYIYFVLKSLLTLLSNHFPPDTSERYIHMHPLHVLASSISCLSPITRSLFYYPDTSWRTAHLLSLHWKKSYSQNSRYYSPPITWTTREEWRLLL